MAIYKKTTKFAIWSQILLSLETKYQRTRWAESPSVNTIATFRALIITFFHAFPSQKSRVSVFSPLIEVAVAGIAINPGELLN